MTRRTATILTTIVMLFVYPMHSAFAQAEDDDSRSQLVSTSDSPADDDIQTRIMRIYSQIDALSAVGVHVREGVVFLSGSVSNERQAVRAIALAERLQGVVTVDDDINRSLDIQGNIVPLVDRLKDDFRRWTQALPLVAIALAIFLVFAYIGHRLARWSGLWRRVSPNSFIGELLGQTVRIITIILGLILALNVLGATALIGTILGGAGVAGLAIGFAVRDSLENYISSIMLSLRQPFRANDHVVIGSHEGKVMRLTTRATVLMTLDGNHLRIPNAQVFKAVILNYTRNPERRFKFELGVDADDDPIAAMTVGLDTLGQLPFVLDDPEPKAVISAVGDSNIVLTFLAWVDQQFSDFEKSRSLAIGATKTVLEEKGFTLPEPIYRLRFDQKQLQTAAGLKEMASPQTTVPDTDADVMTKPISNTAEENEGTMDVSPDTHLEEIVNQERAMNVESDLLDNDRPVE